MPKADQITEIALYVRTYFWVTIYYIGSKYTCSEDGHGEDGANLENLLCNPEVGNIITVFIMLLWKSVEFYADKKYSFSNLLFHVNIELV